MDLEVKTRVIKRNGEEVDFRLEKIVNAIKKAIRLPVYAVIQAVSLSTPSFIKFFIRFCGFFHCFQIHIRNL